MCLLPFSKLLWKSFLDNPFFNENDFIYYHPVLNVCFSSNLFMKKLNKPSINNLVHIIILLTDLSTAKNNLAKGHKSHLMFGEQGAGEDTGIVGPVAAFGHLVLLTCLTTVCCLPHCTLACLGSWPRTFFMMDRSQKLRLWPLGFPRCRR